MSNFNAKKMDVAAIILIMALGITGQVHAQPAPVYDIESLQPSPYAAAEAEPPQEGSLTVVDGPVQMSESNPQFVPAETNGPSRAQMNSVPSDQSDLRTNSLEPQFPTIETSEGHEQLESLQTQVQDLRGQVEKLTHDLALLQKKHLASADTEKPLTQLDQAQPSKEEANEVLDTPVAEKPADKTENKIVATGPIEKLDVNAAKKPIVEVDEEQQIYQSAYNLIKTKKYADAVTVLQQMLKKYPRGQFASNAHYWLGELFGLQGNTDKALDEFNVIVKNYPKSPRISDAQLKVGLILASQLKWGEAKMELRKVVRTYPGTASAKTAMEQLKQIKQAGH